jgi:hypothetical protein
MELPGMKIPRMLIIRIHAFLACFIMPMATLYFVGGALYSSDIKGDIDKQVYQLPVESAFVPELARLSALARSALEQHELLLPGGEASIREKKGSYEYRWGDLKRLVVIQPTNDPLEIELTYRERSPLAQVMRVHRAEAGTLVQIFSISMAIALLVILASGVFLALGIPKLRRTAMLSLGAGMLIVVTIFM